MIKVIFFIDEGLAIQFLHQTNQIILCNQLHINNQALFQTEKFR